MPSLKVDRTRPKLPETKLVSEIFLFLAGFLVLCFKILSICFPFTLESNVFENLTKGDQLTDLS